MNWPVSDARKADAVIAETLDGWKLINTKAQWNYAETRSTGWHGSSSLTYIVGVPKGLYREDIEDYQQNWRSIPEYEKGSHALGLTERLRLAGHYIEICSLVDTPDANWVCKIRPNNSPWEAFSGTGVIMEEAIKEAAFLFALFLRG